MQTRFVGQTSGNMSTLRMCSITGIGHETKLRVQGQAGTIVRRKTKFRDMNVHVPAHDERAIEVLASFVVSHQLAMDIKRSDCPGPRMSQRIPGELQSSHALGAEVPRALVQRKPFGGGCRRD